MPASLLDLFLQNWARPPKIETSWLTYLQTTFNDASESRQARLGKPYRTLTHFWTGVSRAESVRILQLLGRNSDQQVALPLLQDVSKVTASSSGTTIHCDTASRRFYAGSRCVIHELSGGRPSDAEIATIDTVGGSSLTLSGPLSGTFPEGSLVYPAVDARQVLSNSPVVFESSYHGLVSAVFSEAEGSSALPASVAIGSDAGFGTHPDLDGNGSYPVLEIEPDWGSQISVAFVRDGKSESVGLGTVVSVFGSRPRFRFVGVYRQLNRADAWSMIKLFDGRRGRLLPFWFLSPLEHWNAINLGSTSVEITAEGEFDDLSFFYTAIGFRLKDGSYIVRKITSFTDGSTWILGFDAVGFSLSDIERVAPAYFVRFYDDAMEEVWLTDQVAEFNFDLIEVLEEQDVTIGQIDTYEPDI